MVTLEQFVISYMIGIFVFLMLISIFAGLCFWYQMKIKRGIDNINKKLINE